MRKLTCVELCAGAGGQSIGLERAGFDHLALVDVEAACVNTLRLNRPEWNVIHADVRSLPGNSHLLGKPDLLAAGLPCPPFSVAGKQLGNEDERDLFPATLNLVAELNPSAVLIENVPGLLSPKFDSYRAQIRWHFEKLGYRFFIHRFNACDFGVPQLRPRVTIVALKEHLAPAFRWPAPSLLPPPTVGEALYDLMAANGWEGAEDWKGVAAGVAPTVVGGSKKHGGPDLGPSRARAAWRLLGVDGGSVVDAAPPKGFEGLPRLTVRMVARLQGFPDDWQFWGRRTTAYRQVGNAFPPPVAHAVASQIAGVFEEYSALTEAV